MGTITTQLMQLSTVDRRVLAAVVAWDREARSIRNGVKKSAFKPEAFEDRSSALASAWKVAQERVRLAFLSSFQSGRIAGPSWRYGSEAENEAALAAVGLKHGSDLFGQPGVDETFRYRGIVGLTATGFGATEAGVVAGILAGDREYADSMRFVLANLPVPGGSTGGGSKGGGGGGGSGGGELYGPPVVIDPPAASSPVAGMSNTVLALLAIGLVWLFAGGGK